MSPYAAPPRGRARQPAGAGADHLLGPESVVAYLVAQGVLDGATAGRAKLLGGGVSNVVLSVADAQRSVVVKQARTKLRVEGDWYAPPTRAMAEADALELVGGITPGRVPRVLARDPARHVVVIERAPAGWEDWKSLLLAGRVEPSAGGELGALVAVWHSRTRYGPMAPSLEEGAHLEPLRLAPYYRAAAARHPSLRSRLTQLAEGLSGQKVCLVHGDCSPKNVMVGADGLWVIDFEVAHRGDPVFDLAFMLCHLQLKALHRPELAERYDDCADRFIAAYEAGGGPGLHGGWEHVSSHVGCLLLARVDGKSPAEYLGPAEREQVRALGASLLSLPAAELAQLSARRRQVCR